MILFWCDTQLLISKRENPIMPKCLVRRHHIYACVLPILIKGRCAFITSSKIRHSVRLKSDISKLKPLSNSIHLAVDKSDTDASGKRDQ